MTDQYPDDRAEQAARAWFAQEASGDAPGSIDPAVVRAAAGRRQRLRFTGLLAAAAVLVAALVIVPLALRPANPPITGIPADSATEPTWTTTAPPPLTPRWGSLTAWLDGRFYLLGGWDGGPCPPGSACDMPAPTLRDGAAYDPAADSWTMVAEAPVPIGRGFAEVVAFQGAIYVQSSIDDGSFWLYHPDVDAWQELARPPSYGRLVATPSLLAINTYDGDPAHYAYRPGDDSWIPLPEGPIDSCNAWSSQAAGERLLVVGRCGTELRTSFFDPESSEWSQAAVVPGVTVERNSYNEGGDAVYVAGSLTWPGRLWIFSSVLSPGIYDIESQAWREVPTDITPGGLSYRGLLRSDPVVLDGLGLVEANGNLLDVRTATWLKVPEAPIPDRWDPVEAVGPDSLLSCFGYHYGDDSFQGGRFADGCQLLTLGATAPSSPTAVPTDSSAAPTSPTEPPTPGAGGLAWREIASPDSNPRSEALLVAVNDDFYLMGGYRPPAPDEDGEQIAVGYRFDPDYGDGRTAWTAIAALPELALSRPYRLSADVVGEIIYVHFTFEERGELWAYETRTDSWRKVGDSDEGDYFVGTEDGLVKVQSVDDSLPRLQLLSDDGQWVELPARPMGRGAFRLGDHQLGYLTADYRLAVLDTATRSWLAPSEPGEIGSHEAFGVEGAAVFVYRPDSEGELMPNHKYGLNVVTLVDGTWTNPEPMLTDGGLGSEIGAVAGRWIVISGNLFDPRTQQWLPVPAIPGSGYQWVSTTVAGGPQGVLSCFPIRDIDEPEPRPVDTCYLLTVP